MSGMNEEMLSASLKLQATAGQRWAEPLIARIAAETWRLGRRLRRIQTDDRLGPLRDSLNRLEDLLAEYRVETIEHDGQDYDPGLRVEVLHEREGSGNLTILETIRPTILLDGRTLLHGQVVIGPAADGGEQ